MIKLNLRKVIVSFFLMLSISVSTFGQKYVAFTKSNFKSNLSEFKVAIKQYQNGD